VDRSSRDQALHFVHPLKVVGAATTANRASGNGPISLESRKLRDGRDFAPAREVYGEREAVRLRAEERRCESLDGDEHSSILAM
jgi:hypothetical protein